MLIALARALTGQTLLYTTSARGCWENLRVPQNQSSLVDSKYELLSANLGNELSTETQKLTALTYYPIRQSRSQRLPEAQTQAGMTRTTTTTTMPSGTASLPSCKGSENNILNICQLRGGPISLDRPPR
jgi:hypothetical protein